MNADDPAIIAGSSVKAGTLADGTLRISVDIEPRHAQAAFAMFGTPGTPVAIARLVPEAAQRSAQRETVEEQSWGHVYQDLFRLGWFFNPRVAEAFGTLQLPTTERVASIKQAFYDEFNVTSLSELEPHNFVAMCEALGIRDTIPASVIEAAT